MTSADGGPHPNVDFALGVLARDRCTWSHGAGEAIFAVARSAGWIAHGLEEYQHRLRYRIRATYTGRSWWKSRRRYAAASERRTFALGQPARRCWRRWSRKSTST